jgi:hypothetical protein
MPARKTLLNLPKGAKFRHRGHDYVLQEVNDNDEVIVVRAKGAKKGDGSYKDVTGNLADVVVHPAGGYCFAGCAEPRADGRRGIAEVSTARTNNARKIKRSGRR